jgi:hypothetical protein
VIRAAWLASMLAETTTNPQQYHLGLTIRGARLIGPADWSHRVFGRPLTFVECWLDTQGPLSLAHAAVHSLVLRDCRTRAINAHRLSATHHVVFRDCDVRGFVDLSDARIDGTWKLSGSTIAPPTAHLEDGGWAVSGDGATIGGNIMFDGANFAGDLSLRVVRVSGGVSGLAATLQRSSISALNLDGARIGGDVFWATVAARPARYACAKPQSRDKSPVAWADSSIFGLSMARQTSTR